LNAKAFRSTAGDRCGSWASLVLGLVVLVVGIIAGVVRENPREIELQAREQVPQIYELDRLLSECTASIRSRTLRADGYRRLLGANEIVYKRVETDRGWFELYAAYWRQGNAYGFEALQHPPDVCWAGVGWQCEAVQSERVFAVGELPLFPGEWRQFSSPDGAAQEVLFWCISGRQCIPLGYRSPEVILPRVTWTDFVRRSKFLRYWLSGPKPSDHAADAAKSMLVNGDMYFVRVNSPQKIAAVIGSAEFKACTRFLAAVGVMPYNGSGSCWAEQPHDNLVSCQARH